MEILISFFLGALLVGAVAYLKMKSLRSQLETAQQASQEAQVTNARMAGQLSSLEADQAKQEKFARQLLAEQEKKFTALQAQSETVFKQLATDVLQRQRAELTNRNTELVSPLKETMEKFTKQVGDLRTESTAHHSVLQQAIERTLQLNENLSQEAQNLTQALKSPKKQGTWGEIILEDVLTAAGFRKGIEFDTQVSFTHASGARQQPDFILHLPGKRDLVIDSKMSFNAYLQWQSAQTEEEKQKYLKEHVQSVEKHIKELAAQDYTALLPNEKLDFTFMFIPIEYAYFLAVQAKPELNEFARQQRVAIVTASNLFSVLQIADNLWRQERSSQLTEQIFKTAQEMLERTGRFAQRMEDLHTRINQLDKAYSEADKALRGGQGIVGSAKKLEAMRIKSARKLPELVEEEPLFLEKNEQ